MPGNLISRRVPLRSLLHYLHDGPQDARIAELECGSRQISAQTVGIFSKGVPSEQPRQSTVSHLHRAHIEKEVGHHDLKRGVMKRSQRNNQKVSVKVQRTALVALPGDWRVQEPAAARYSPLGQGRTSKAEGEAKASKS